MAGTVPEATMSMTGEDELQGLVAYNIGRAKDFARRINDIGNVDSDTLTSQDLIDTTGVVFSLNGYLGTINLAADVLQTHCSRELSDVTGIEADTHLQEFFSTHRTSSVEMRSTLSEVNTHAEGRVIIVPNIDTEHDRFYFNLAHLPDPVADYYGESSRAAYIDTDHCPSVPLSELCLEYANSITQWERSAWSSSES